MLVHNEDVLKTGFRTCWGSYEFWMMSFGVTKASLQFMHLVQDILYEYFDDFVIILIDGILIFSCTKKENVKHLKLVV